MPIIPGFITVSVPTFPLVIFDHSFYPRALATSRAIEQMDRKFRNFKEPLNTSLRQIIIPSIKHNFAVEGRPPWRQLARGTVRNRKGSAHPILIRKKTLMRKATQINIWRVERDEMYVVGLDQRVRYAKFHQGGTFKMPARPFMVFHNEDIMGMEMIFGRWMEKVMDESGF